MLGKMEGGEGDNLEDKMVITNSMDMSLSKLGIGDAGHLARKAIREAWHAAVIGSQRVGHD